jgi:ABC-type phosphate transport system substrate-binding protein
MPRPVIVVVVGLATALLAGILASGQSRSSASSAGGSAEQALVIIVNQSNPIENCSFDELRKIFLGERAHWPNGRRITLVMLDPAQPERKMVLKEIYGMTEKDFNNHFIQGVFTGSVLVSPKTMTSAADVRKFVFNVPGAIGYVRAADADASVKILRVDGRLPDDKDYRLRLQAHSAKP